VVLDLRADDVAGAPGRRDALDAEVVRLRASRREHDLVLRHPEEAGDLLARDVEALARRAAEAVHAGGVAESLAEVGEHGLQHLGMHGRGRVVVEIDEPVH